MFINFFKERPHGRSFYLSKFKKDLPHEGLIKGIYIFSKNKELGRKDNYSEKDTE